MLLEMKVPSPGESISEVEIAEWLVEDGDYVEKDQSIAEIDSDKATLELPAEESGSIKIVVGDGETVAVGDVVCIIDTSVKGESKIKDTKEEVRETTKSTLNPEKNLGVEKATPLASAMISEHDILVKELKGTGEAGKITKSDVLGAIQGNSTDGPRGTSRKKMSSLRRKIARRLVSVKNETAMLTTFNEVDMLPIKELRSKYGNEFEKEHGVKLGFMGFFVIAAVQALKKFPVVNASMDGNDIVYHGYQDIGVAVSTERGLVVPIIKDADTKSLPEIEKAILEYSEKARDGKLSIEEMQGGTFTISNGGIFGSLLSTPILNAPQTAILGMHAIQERPVAINGEVLIRPMMYLAMSYDHRLLDGKEAVTFLVSIKEQLESPERLLLNL